jgi:broad specificity phosphatase PhoE
LVLASLADVYLVRHGETQWSLSGQHTGLTDIPLTAGGEEQARWLQRRLRDVTFTKVFTSPLQRAMRTCEIAGYAPAAEVDRDLLEWNYGDYEGKKRSEILASRPGWIVFRDGCPNGESPAEVGARADRIIARVRQVDGRVALFSSGHFLRTLIARWIGLPPSGGGFFKLGTAALSILGFDHEKETEPVIRVVNETEHK